MSQQQNTNSSPLSLSLPPSGGGPPPCDEQKRYWAQDLFIKKLGSVISAAGFIFIIAGLYFTHRQIKINTEQLQLNTAQSEKVAKSIRANVENAIVTHVTSLDQIFIHDPSLTPYFYEQKQISKTDKSYPEVSATAVMVLDVFDLVATQNKHYPEFWDTPEAWDNWMIGVFTTSPILRDFIDTHPSWYGKSVKSLRDQAREKTGQ